MTCQKELKAAGKSYARMCEECLLGPCKYGHDRPVFANSEVTFAGRMSGMNEPDQNGSYVGLVVVPDNGSTKTVRVKISCAEAELLARDLLKNT